MPDETVQHQHLEAPEPNGPGLPSYPGVHMQRTVYDTPFHRAQRKEWTPIVNAGGVDCAEIRCLMRDRHIEPGTPWQLAHDRTVCIWPRHRCTPACYLGPAHVKCNTSEGATHGNRGGVKRWRI